MSSSPPTEQTNPPTGPTVPPTDDPATDGAPSAAGATGGAAASGSRVRGARTGSHRERRPRRLGGPAGWPLRTRLVAALIALLALVCVLVGVTTQVALQRSLYGQVDAQLVEASVRAYARVDDFEPELSAVPGKPGIPGAGRFDHALSQAPGTLIARLRNGRVDKLLVIEGAEAERQATATQAAALLALPQDGRLVTAAIDGLGDFRLTARYDPRAGGVVVTGLPLRNVQSVVYLVAGIELVVIVAALLAAGLAGAVIIRRNLRPLHRMAATAGRVAELRLDRGEVALAERVPEADTDPRTEVGQVGAALNRMLDHVGNALEARHASESRVRQFVADASHELRTPLAAIRGYAELSRRSPETLSPELTQVLGRVESEAQRMTGLVEDLLLLARLDSGRPLARQRVDLSPLVVDAVSDAHVTGPGHQWRLQLPDEPVTVVGDPARLHQVLANLLSNARTHTAPGTTVTAEVTATAAGAVLRIADSGPGIPPALLPHVFERFARGDTSRSRAAGSTGLGLAIVHAVTTAHGGTVEVDSMPGRTVFTVRLPLAPSEPDGPAPADGPARAQTDGRVDRAPPDGYPERRDPMVFTVYEAGHAAGDSAMKP